MLFVINQIRMILFVLFVDCACVVTDLSWAAIGTDFNIFIAMQMSRSFSTSYVLCSNFITQFELGCTCLFKFDNLIGNLNECCWIK